MRTTYVARTTTDSIPRDACQSGTGYSSGRDPARGVLDAAGNDAGGGCRALGMSTVRLNELVRGKRGVTADTALRLAQLFKTTPQLWMHMQANFDLKVAMARRRAMKLTRRP